eukprot:scaffold277463_cov54-Attheya_sp.AAC.3
MSSILVFQRSSRLVSGWMVPRSTPGMARHAGSSTTECSYPKRKRDAFPRLSSTSESQAAFSLTQETEQGGVAVEEREEEPLYRCEGLLAVNKPLEWTSQDVVGYIRRMLERDARERGAPVMKLKKRGNKKLMIRVGHGGTLDPLATGVLVIGVGKGTKQLQQYLNGNKRYTASAELGYETTTLDLEGNITKSIPWDQISDSIEIKSLEAILPQFKGTIQQVPPMFSAIKKNGKKLYEMARKGVTEEDMTIEPREVQIHQLDLLPDTDNHNKKGLPHFYLNVECGGGTYIRSLIRDMGHSLDTYATMTGLVRTKQGPFTLDDTFEKDEWNPDTLYAAIEKSNQYFASLDQTSEETE